LDSRVNSLRCRSHTRSLGLYLVGSKVFRRMGRIVLLKLDISGFSSPLLLSILKLHSNSHTSLVPIPECLCHR
jgi:hypothetical protein